MLTYVFFFNATATPEIYTLSLHDALPILFVKSLLFRISPTYNVGLTDAERKAIDPSKGRSEEHTSELQSHVNLVCRLLLEKKNRGAPSACPDRTVGGSPTSRASRRLTEGW